MALLTGWCQWLVLIVHAWYSITDVPNWVHHIAIGGVWALIQICCCFYLFIYPIFQTISKCTQLHSKSMVHARFETVFVDSSTRSAVFTKQLTLISLATDAWAAASFWPYLRSQINIEYLRTDGRVHRFQGLICDNVANAVGESVSAILLSFGTKGSQRKWMGWQFKQIRLYVLIARYTTYIGFSKNCLWSTIFELCWLISIHFEKPINYTRFVLN